MFNHISQSDGYSALADLKQHHINMVMAKNVVPDTTLAYLKSIDYHAHFKSDWESEKPQALSCIKNCSACTLFEPPAGRHLFIEPADFRIRPFDSDAREVVKSALHKFPQTQGVDDFTDTALDIVKNFSKATAYERVAVFITAKYPVGRAAWHRDNGTDYRGLITFFGPGTFWRPNESVPDADWDQNMIDERGLMMNLFGHFGREYMDAAHQAKSGHMMIWKGDQHPRPFIHAEPTWAVAGRRDMRLLMTMHQS